MKKVATVLHAQIQILKTNPPQWSITAIGVVTSGGWTNPRLVPRDWILPEQSFLDLDFVADPPEGITIRPLLPIQANTIWHDPPTDAIGVRIHAEANYLEARADAAPKLEIKLHAGGEKRT